MLLSDRPVESYCTESIFFSLPRPPRATEDQVLSFLDHVLANEDDEREANEQSNSIKKKDSGYGSQGHLKLEVDFNQTSARTNFERFRF